MTTKDFKDKNPHLSHLEGNELWDAMEHYMLIEQYKQGVINKNLPFFKRYQLRWLFYRRIPNMSWGKDNYTSSERCSKCKKGVSSSFGYIFQGKMFMHCTHCGKDLQKEKNTNINHRIWVVCKLISDSFWTFLDKIHLVRSQVFGRYEMMGDEYKYVEYWNINLETGKTCFTLKKRKWFEYIFIEKPVSLKTNNK